MKYFFIGTECQVGDVSLEQFGTEIFLDREAALNALDGGAQLCPEDQFSFTQQEVTDYPYPAFQDSAPEAFHVKLHAARMAVAAHLEALKAPIEVIEDAE